jgi:hypothetical protein
MTVIAKSLAKSLASPFAKSLAGGQDINRIGLRVTAGLFDFSWDNAAGRKWVFPDGSAISTDARPTRTLTKGGIVWLYCDEFAGNFRLNSNTTTSNYVGKLTDFQGKLTYFLNLYNCTNTTGPLSALLGKITFQLGLTGCSLVYGSLSELQGKITNTLSLAGCQFITGVYTPVAAGLPSITYLSNTGISTADMDQNLINYAAAATTLNKLDGMFTAIGMTRTAASDDAIATLTGLGWTVAGLTKI